MFKEIGVNGVRGSLLQTILKVTSRNYSSLAKKKLKVSETLMVWTLHLGLRGLAETQILDFYYQATL